MTRPTFIHPLRFVSAALAVLALTVFGRPAGAALAPYYSIQTMCFKADLVVSGEDRGDGEVEVDQVFFAADDDARPDAGGVLHVPALPQHTRDFTSPFGIPADENTAPLTTRRLVLFLAGSHATGWTPMGHKGPGSQGVIWVEAEACLGYRQVVNPGPFVLHRGGHSRVPATPEALDKAVSQGLKLREGWAQALATANPVDRAHAIAAYLLPETAPADFDAVLPLRKELAQLGPDAVPALQAVFENAGPDADLNTAALALSSVAAQHPTAAQPALPAVCARLKHPGPTATYYLLCALTGSGDPQIIPHVRPFLASDDEQVATQAAVALAAAGDDSSFDAIAARLHRLAAESARGSSGSDLGQALFTLDPDRARPVIHAVEKDGLPGLRHFISGFETDPASP